MKFKVNALLCLFVIALVLALPGLLVASAKPSVSLSFFKNNGYGMGNDMGGAWTANADTSSDVVRVEFYLNDQLQQNDTSKPFSWQFDTNNYTPGPYTIKAVAFDAQGQNATASVDRNFQEYSASGTLAIIGAVVAVVVIISILAVYRMRKQR